MKGLSEELQKLLEDEKIYDLCCELGYQGTKEELLSEIKNSFESNDFSELTPEELEFVAGGARKGFGVPQRGVAAILTCTSLMGNGLPSASAQAKSSNSQVSAGSTISKGVTDSILKKLWGSRKSKIITSSVLAGTLATILAGGAGAAGLGAAA